MSQHLSITLFFYIAFFVLFVSRADAAFHAQPDHRRLLRKRIPQLVDLPLGPPGTPSAGSTTSAILTQSTPTLGSTDAAPTAPVSTTASQVSTGVSSSTSQSTISASPSNTSSPSSYSTVSSTSTSGASSRSSLHSDPSPTGIITSSGVSDSLKTDTLSPTVTSSSSPSSSAQTQAAVTASSNQKTMTAIIVVASAIGGITILWTLFRKWKLGRSSKFDERLQPIDWQPTSDDNRRPLSTASSFHSGGHGFGTEPHDQVQNAPLPDHDFTALPSSRLAAVGGYADLARGPSPQPPMQEAYGSHNPVTGGPNYDVNIPLHHQGGYGGRDAYNYASMGY